MLTQAHGGCCSETADSPPPCTSPRTQLLRLSKQLCRRIPVAAMGKENRAQPQRPQIPSAPSPEGVASGGKRAKGAYCSEGHRACLWKLPDSPPFLCGSLPFSLHFPSPLLFPPQFRFYLTFPLPSAPFFLFTPSVLQGNIMGRAGQSEKTWQAQALPLLIPSHNIWGKLFL